MFDDKSLVIMYNHGIVSAQIQLSALPSWSLSWKLVITADQNRQILESAASERFMAAWQDSRLALVCHAVCALHSSVLSCACAAEREHKEGPVLEVQVVGSGRTGCDGDDVPLRHFSGNLGSFTIWEEFAAESFWGVSNRVIKIF